MAKVQDASTERRPLTYEDYCALPDDGRRYEVMDGELYVVPSANRAHQRFVGNLFVVLHAHIRAHGLGEVFVAPFDVILEQTSVVVPDIVFVSRDRLAVVTERAVEGAPDLIVEALSPGTERQDRVEKSQLYARHGVRHYWLGDPAFRILEAFELGEGAYRLSASLGAEEVFAPTLFPALMIPLRDLWG